MLSLDRDKSKQGLLTKFKKGSFKVKVKSKPFSPKPETRKLKKLTHVPTLKKEDARNAALKQLKSNNVQ